jgi:sugar fermentation stimulation protein A
MPDYHTDLYFAQTLLKIRNTVEVIPVSVGWDHDLSLRKGVRILSIPWAYIEREAHDKGSYLIVLELSKDKRINVGKLGTVLFEKGFYVYVGSAMANLASRIERHQRLRKNFHWHIDFLRDSADFLCSFAIRSSDRLECEIARSISKIAQWSVKEFGSSDCTCATHLFGFTDNPVSLPSFQKLLQHFRMDRYVGAGGK